MLFAFSDKGPEIDGVQHVLLSLPCNFAPLKRLNPSSIPKLVLSGYFPLGSVFLLRNRSQQLLICQQVFVLSTAANLGIFIAIPESKEGLGGWRLV